ncbi:MAG: c-type cytochrome, partial [Pirellulales bacterium]|nr:c-type cytochrome [Pirellulales bacterium]
ASVLLGVQRQEMIELLLDFLAQHPDASNREELLKHTARHATPETLARCVQLARRITRDVDGQFQLLTALSDSQNAQPGNVPPSIARWASDLVREQLNQFEQLSDRGAAIAWTADDGGRWPQRQRKRGDGRSASLVDSIQRGESYTGQMRSDAFSAPAEIKFWLAGHNGFPKDNDHRKNKVRLVDAESGDVLFEAFPPRNDVARLIRWQTKGLSGRQVRVLCIDGDSASAYAWLAIGDFEPAWILSLEQNDSLLTALHWIKRLGLAEHEPRLAAYLEDERLSQQLQIEVAGAIAALRNNAEASVVLQFLGRAPSNAALTGQVIAAMMAGDPGELSKATELLAKGLPASQQREFALSWARGGADPELLVQMCGDGWISPAAVADVDVRQSLWPRLSAQSQQQFQSLTQNIDAGAAQREALKQLRQTLAAQVGDAGRGHQVFKKHCAACHQLHGEGTVVGPQLDGAITRSVDRLLEDIVTPDHNVDKAFRTTSFLLDDGRVLVGLVRAETQREISVVDSKGKNLAIDPDSIERRQESSRSLMPSNFSEVLSPAEINDLLKFIRRPKR